MKGKETKSRSSEYSSETNFDQELENSEVTNFLISISPDGRIESIGQFGNIDEERPGCIKSLFKATVQSRLLSPDLYEQTAITLLVTVFPDGRMKTFRSSNTPLEDWDINWHRSQYQKILAANLRAEDPDPGPITHVWVDPKDPEVDKKVLALEKMGKVMPIQPVVKKDSDKLNDACPHLQEFAGWFGNARRIPLSIDDENYDAKLEALEDAGFIFSPVNNIWLRS